MVRFYLVNAGLLLAVLLSACQVDNPAYIKRTDGPVAQDAKVEPPGEDAAPDALPPPVDGSRADGPDVLTDLRQEWADTGGDGRMDAIGPDVLPGADGRDGSRPPEVAPEVTPEAGPPDVPRDQAPDLDVARDSRDGPLPDVVIDADTGSDVAPPPIDVAPACTEGVTTLCSTPGNPLIGACREGRRTCRDGNWTECKDEVLPAAEQCNGNDDDCDGMTDEGCVESCVVVAPGPEASDADGTAAKPFRTVQAGLAFASAIDGGPTRNVCVAGGATCTDPPVAYALAAALTVPDGARVQGNYALSDTTLVYCGDSQIPTTTLQLKSADAAVVFAGGPGAQSEVSGFAIERFGTSGAAASGTISAVSVSGSGNVTLSRLFITDEPVSDTTYGIVVKGTGQTTIVRSAITAGHGKTMAAAVYVSTSKAIVRDNCDQIVRGVCQSSCEAGKGLLGLRGRTVGSAGAEAAGTSAVYVEGSVDTPTDLAANLLCGGHGLAIDDVQGANVATLRCTGGACRVATGNTIVGGGGTQSVAVAVSNGSAALRGNLVQAGCGSERRTGVLTALSPARLENNRILGSGCNAGSSASLFDGVRVANGTGATLPEMVFNVIDPTGNGGACESRAVLIESGDAAPSGILRNNILAAGNCKKRFAVEEAGSAALAVIQNNDIYPGPESPADATTVLYSRKGNELTSLDQVNALAGASANISADPAFVAYPSDLHLKPESPCIDKGTAADVPQTDGDGVARPQGAGHDIGPYEYLAPARQR